MVCEFNALIKIAHKVPFMSVVIYKPKPRLAQDQKYRVPGEIRTLTMIC